MINKDDFRNYWNLSQDKRDLIQRKLNKLPIPIKVLDRLKIVLYPNQYGQITLTHGCIFETQNGENYQFLEYNNCIACLPEHEKFEAENIEYLQSWQVARVVKDSECPHCKVLGL